MDIEQLKLVIEAARAAGEGAFDVALLWIGYQFLSSLLGYVTFGAVMFGAYKLLRTVVGNFLFINKVQKIVGSGMDPDYGDTEKKFLLWLENRFSDHPVHSWWMAKRENL